MAEIQEGILKKGGRNLFSRLVHARNDKEAITAWKLDLNSILHIFNVCWIIFTWLSLTNPLSQTELIMNTHVTVSDIHRGVSKIQEEISGQPRPVTVSRIQPIDSRRTLTIT